MMHDSNGWHWLLFGHWAFGILFWLIVILLIAALVKYLYGRGK
jgi:hypothetical protein